VDTVYTGSPQLIFLNLELFFHLFSWICDDSIAPQIQRLHHRRSDAHCSLRLEAIECRIIRENFLIESIASQIHPFESILLKTTQSTILEKINLISVLCWANMVLWISLSARLPPPCVCCAMPRCKRKPRMDARAHGPGDGGLPTKRAYFFGSAGPLIVFPRKVPPAGRGVSGAESAVYCMGYHAARFSCFMLHLMMSCLRKPGSALRPQSGVLGFALLVTVLVSARTLVSVRTLSCTLAPCSWRANAW
jgi:hypothetical protein